LALVGMPYRETTLFLEPSLQRAVEQDTRAVLVGTTMGVLVVAVTAILRVREFLGKAIRVGSLILAVLEAVVVLALLD
jgi:hypothetical protein